MTSSSPLVSIGLPTLNRYELLQRSLDSVTAQTLGNFECVIIDNYSDDNTPDVCAAMTAKDSRFQCHRQTERVTTFDNHNNPFARTSEDREYYCFFADDDLWGPTFLEQCVTALERDPELVAVAPQFCYPVGESRRKNSWIGRT